MEYVKKPGWIRMHFGKIENFAKVKSACAEKKLNTVCESAKCPNLGECFGRATASFLILGDICTRRCPFCNIAHGKPLPPNPKEAENLAQTVLDFNLKYVVITSVDRDDLKDGGASHFVLCIQKIRSKKTNIKIEILTPDFRGRLEKALNILSQNPPDVLNHNLETVPRLYKKIRPGADYKNSLKLLKIFKEKNPNIFTKSGLMLGLGENKDEIIAVLKDLKRNGVDFLTLGQYLQPTKSHAPVQKFYTPEEFKEFAQIAQTIGFFKIASAPMVRSSYWADYFFEE